MWVWCVGPLVVASQCEYDWLCIRDKYNLSGLPNGEIWGNQKVMGVEKITLPCSLITTKGRRKRKSMDSENDCQRESGLDHKSLNS